MDADNGFAKRLSAGVLGQHDLDVGPCPQQGHAGFMQRFSYQDALHRGVSKLGIDCIAPRRDRFVSR
jgi:hypothetical protein